MTNRNRRKGYIVVESNKVTQWFLRLMVTIEERYYCYYDTIVKTSYQLPQPPYITSNDYCFSSGLYAEYVCLWVNKN